MSHKSSPSAPLSSLQRRRLLQSLGALGMAGLPGLAAAQTPPTAKVNTTKLAITDTEVTVGQLHSATGTMAISGNPSMVSPVGCKMTMRRRLSGSVGWDETR